MRRRPRRRPSEGGFTLIEMIVAMGLVSILVTIFMAGVVQMTKATTRVQNTSNSADQARRAFDRFDRQLRSASEINRPVRVVASNTWYLEFRTTATKPGVTNPVCSQWRLNSGTGRLQMRTWPDVASPTVSGWTTIASAVVNDPVTEQPFTMLAADSTYTRQRISLYLEVSNGRPGGAQVRGTIVARNTSTASSTNLDGNGDGVSDTQVCQQAGRP